jgi:hypothetical protein
MRRCRSRPGHKSIPDHAIQFLRHHFGRVPSGAPNVRHLTHGDHHREETISDSSNFGLNLVVRGLGIVQDTVGISNLFRLRVNAPHCHLMVRPREEGE